MESLNGFRDLRMILLHLGTAVAWRKGADLSMFVFVAGAPSRSLEIHCFPFQMTPTFIKESRRVVRDLTNARKIDWGRLFCLDAAVGAGDSDAIVVLKWHRP